MLASTPAENGRLFLGTKPSGSASAPSRGCTRLCVPLTQDLAGSGIYKVSCGNWPSVSQKIGLANSISLSKNLLSRSVQVEPHREIRRIVQHNSRRASEGWQLIIPPRRQFSLKAVQGQSNKSFWVARDIKINPQNLLRPHGRRNKLWRGTAPFGQDDGMRSEFGQPL